MKKRGIVLILGIFLFMLLFAVVWFNWPQGEADLIGLLPGDYFGCVALKMSPSDWHKADEWISAVAAGPKNEKNRVSFFLKRIMPVFSPIKVIVMSDVDADNHWDLLVFVQSPRVVQLARLYKIFDKGTKSKYDLEIYKNVLRITKRGSKFGRPAVGKTPVRSLDSEVLRKEWLGSRDHVFMLANGREERFSTYIKELQQKASYSFFVSIDALQFMKGSLTLLDADNSRGNLSFVYNNEDDMARAFEDVSFFSQLMKRFFKASHIRYTGRFLQEGNCLNLEFHLDRPGL